MIHRSTLEFLRKLSSHNNRDWFNAHKDQYRGALENAEQFMDALLMRMSKHDRFDTLSGKESLYRIYADVRFSKVKLPYNTWLSAYLKRSKPLLRGGYYVRIAPGGSRVSCGFYNPGPDDLRRIREDISLNHEKWKKLLASKFVKRAFGPMVGDRVRTAPRGFSPEHPAIDLLRYKQFWFQHSFTDEEVLAKDFVVNVDKIFKSIRPLFNYMSEVLTTNLNGELRVKSEQ